MTFCNRFIRKYQKLWTPDLLHTFHTYPGLKPQLPTPLLRLSFLPSRLGLLTKVDFRKLWSLLRSPKLGIKKIFFQISKSLHPRVKKTLVPPPHRPTSFQNFLNKKILQTWTLRGPPKTVGTSDKLLISFPIGPDTTSTMCQNFNRHLPPEPTLISSERQKKWP